MLKSSQNHWKGMRKATTFLLLLKLVCNILFSQTNWPFFQHSQGFHLVALTQRSNHVEKVLFTFSLEIQLLFPKSYQRLEHLPVKIIILKFLFKLITELHRKPYEKTNWTQNWPKYTVDFISLQLFNQKPQNAIVYFESLWFWFRKISGYFDQETVECFSYCLPDTQFFRSQVRKHVVNDVLMRKEVKFFFFFIYHLRAFWLNAKIGLRVIA